MSSDLADFLSRLKTKNSGIILRKLITLLKYLTHFGLYCHAPQIEI